LSGIDLSGFVQVFAEGGVVETGELAVIWSEKLSI